MQSFSLYLNFVADCKIAKSGIFTRLFGLNTTDFSPFLWYNLIVKNILKNGEKIMRNKVVQLSLFDTYTDVLKSMEENKS